jgi:hypothetical protein
MQDKLISLYTEDKGNIPELVSKYFDGFTIHNTTGYWQGKPEKSVRIDIACDLSAYDVKYNIADLILVFLAVNKQQSVMVVAPDDQVYFADNGHVTAKIVWECLK